MLWAQSTHEIKDWLQILYYTHVAVKCTEHVSLHSPRTEARTTNLNRERKVGSSWSLAAWWTTSVAASFWLNLHHHHSLHHSWPSPGSERAKGGPALDFQLQITEISRNVDLRTSGTGRIYPVPIWSGYGWDLSHLRRFQRHESELTSKSKSQRFHSPHSPHPKQTDVPMQNGQFPMEIFPMCVLRLSSPTVSQEVSMLGSFFCGFWPPKAIEVLVSNHPLLELLYCSNFIFFAAFLIQNHHWF